MLGALSDTAATLKPQTVTRMRHEPPFKTALQQDHRNLNSSNVLSCLLQPNPKAFLCQKCQIPASRPVIQLDVLTYGNWWKPLWILDFDTPTRICPFRNPGRSNFNNLLPVSHDLVCEQIPPIHEKFKLAHYWFTSAHESICTIRARCRLDTVHQCLAVFWHSYHSCWMSPCAV